MTREHLLPVYQETLPRMRALAGRYLHNDSSDVEDVLQDVFLQAWLHCESLREDTRCGGWLLRITTNTCLTYLRRAKRRTLCDTAPADAAEDVYARMMEHLAVESVLEPLSPAARQVVWLHDLEGYPMREVARKMRRPESTLRMVLYRARAKLRRSS